MQDNNERWSEIRKIHKEYRFFYIVGAGFFLVAFGIWLGWQVFPPGKLLDYNINLWNTFIGTGITVLILDRLNELRAQRQLKAQLIREMNSSDNGIARRAASEMEASGWLTDGSLRHKNLREANLQNTPLTGADLRGCNLVGAKLASSNLRFASLQGAKLTIADLHKAFLLFVDFREANLYRANLSEADLANTDFTKAHLAEANIQGANLFCSNLQEANLTGADLQQADFTNANLEAANLTEATLINARNLQDMQLIQVHKLRKASMPDPNGGLYDGRFNLVGDIRQAQDRDIDTNNPALMADFYGVSLEKYLEGQAWGVAQLQKLYKLAEQFKIQRTQNQTQSNVSDLLSQQK